MKKFFISATLIAIFLNLLSFNTNEELTFKIKYGVISAGKATLSIEETNFKDSIDCYKFIARTRTNSTFDKIFKVRDYIESTWDKEKEISYKFLKKLREGNYKQHRIHMYYPEINMTMYMKYRYKQKKFSEKRMDIPDNTQDILSAFYYVRTRDFEPGDTLIVDVTADGRNYPAKIIIHPLETIDTIFGEKECFVLEPILEGEAIFKQTGKIQIWVTNDEEKIPVLLQSKVIFGHFKAVLTDAKNISNKKK